jgi:hypothetical protein
MTFSNSSRRMFLRMGASGLSILALRPLRVAADEEATQLLDTAAAAMAQISSFHFEMETVDGKSMILDNLELNRVVGDVLRPDSFQATLTAKLAIIEVNVDVVSVGGAVWVTDPTKPGTAWQQVATGGERSEGAAFTDIINPDRLFLAAVNLIDDPVIDGTETIEDQECTVITGSFDPKRLRELASPVAGEEGTPSILLEEPVYLSTWVAGDGRVLRIEEEGPLTESDSNDVIRAITFSAFDEPVEIVAPM